MADILCGFSYEDRAGLLNLRDLSASARNALGFQGGELLDHFEAELSEAVARELLSKCWQLRLLGAAQNLETQLKGLESRRRRAR